MRCQKVRSFLSAYCKGELVEKRTGAIAEHLEGCIRCRYEEAAYRELNKSVGELSGYTVSGDFNSLLLKRVANERFKETRSKAYLPKKIPMVTFNRLAPVFATACFIFAFIFSGGMDLFIDTKEAPTYVTIELDNSYMTVQPEWEFNKEVARATRINGLMNQLSNQSSFGSLVSSSQRNSFRSQFKIQQYPPTIRTYRYLQSNSNKGVNSSR